MRERWLSVLVKPEYTSQEQDSGASLLDMNSGFTLGRLLHFSFFFSLSFFFFRLLHFSVPTSSFIEWG